MIHHNIRDRLKKRIRNRKRQTDRSAFARKLTGMTLCVTMAAIMLSAIVCVYALRRVHNAAESDSIRFGRETMSKSKEALESSFMENVKNTACDKANIASGKFYTYKLDVDYLSVYAEEILENPGQFTKRDVVWSENIPIGYKELFLTLCDKSTEYDSLKQTKAGYLANIGDIFRSLASCHPEIITLYIATEDGLMLSYDENVSETEQGAANIKYYDYKKTGWYQLGKTSKEPVFTECYEDGFGRGHIITCVAPFRNTNGGFAGCVALDVHTDGIFGNIVSKGIDESDTAFLVNSEGTIFAEKGKKHNEDKSENISKFEKYPEFSGIVNDIRNGEKNGAVFCTDPETSEKYLLAFADIEDMDLKLLIQCPLSSVLEPINSIENEINQNTVLMNDTIENTIESMLSLCFLLFFILSVISVYVAGKVSYNFSKPLKILADDMKKISLGNLEYRTLVDTDDEIGSLANSFNSMAESIGKYKEDLKEAVSRDERTAMELSLATDIQAHMLPVNFEEFTKGQKYDIYATMTPAKEVAGDFYDFFRIDDDNIVLVMADVSGKGVPAALFMMISMILIKTNAIADRSPSELFRIVNSQLCDNNKEDMFVTAWLARIDINTGKVTAVNAGHEYPALKEPMGKYKLMEDVHGMPLGAFEGSAYKEYEFCLKEDASLFTYTDGVPESTNIRSELFGTDRMLAALNDDPDAVPGQLLKAVKENIDRFVGESEQFDDITMLGFCYRGNGTDHEILQDIVG